MKVHSQKLAQRLECADKFYKDSKGNIWEMRVEQFFDGDLESGVEKCCQISAYNKECTKSLCVAFPSAKELHDFLIKSTEFVSRLLKDEAKD